MKSALLITVKEAVLKQKKTERERESEKQKSTLSRIIALIILK